MRSQRSARAIADVVGGTILAEVTVAAPPERVFRALTSPDEIVRWWGGPDAYTTESFTADLRRGGAWKAEGRGADGTPFAVFGVFLDVDPPFRLVQTWNADWVEGPETTLTYQLQATGDGTLVTIRHEGFAGRDAACRNHAAGWEQVLQWLSRHVVPAATGGADLFYVCRLVPPRRSFAHDMSPEEASVMQEHVAYWTEHLRRGEAIIFGPVADPSGPWGLGVLRVASEEQLRDIEAKDPVIRARKGFRYEILPMIQAVTGA